MRNTEEETPRDVAVREAMEESGDMFSSATKQKLTSMSGYVAWIPASKYCLFFHELTDPEDMDVDRRFNQLPRGRAGGPIEKEPAMVALAWVPLEEMLGARAWQAKEHVHNFTLDMFRTLDSIGAFGIAMHTDSPATAALARSGGAALRQEGGGRARENIETNLIAFSTPLLSILPGFEVGRWGRLARTAARRRRPRRWRWRWVAGEMGASDGGMATRRLRVGGRGG
jgi:hypothetical protein